MLAKKAERAPATSEQEARIVTYWPGDPAIDVEASDLEQFCYTADKDFLKVRVGEKASIVRAHALGGVEASQVPPMDGTTENYLARALVATRLGLDSIKGVTLGREPINRVCMGLTEESLGMLIDDSDDSEYCVVMPGNRAQTAMLEAIPLEPEGGGDDRVPVPTLLGVWIGFHILARTFLQRRARRRAKS